MKNRVFEDIKAKEFLLVIQTQSVIGISHHLCKRAIQSSYFHPSVSASDGSQGLPACLLIHSLTG